MPRMVYQDADGSERQLAVAWSLLNPDVCLLTVWRRGEAASCQLAIPRTLAPYVAAELVPDTVAAMKDLVLELAAMMRVWQQPMAQVMGWTNVGVLQQKLATAQEQLAQLEPPAEGGG